MNFAKFLRTPFIIEHLWWLLLNVKTLRKSKMFRIKNLRMYAIDLFITNYQFILVKIKLNAFFSVKIKTYLSLTQHTTTVE